MKTHRLAQALSSLSSLLKSLPNMNLTDLKSLDIKKHNRLVPPEDMNVIERLEILQSFQKVTKSALVELISRYNLPVTVRSKDAASDLLTKVGKVLLDNPKILQKIRTGPKAVTSASKELLDALGILLKNNKS